MSFPIDERALPAEYADESRLPIRTERRLRTEFFDCLVSRYHRSDHCRSGDHKLRISRHCWLRAQWSPAQPGCCFRRSCATDENRPNLNAKIIGEITILELDNVLLMHAIAMPLQKLENLFDLLGSRQPIWMDAHNQGRMKFLESIAQHPASTNSSAPSTSILMRSGITRDSEAEAIQGKRAHLKTHLLGGRNVWRILRANRE